MNYMIILIALGIVVLLGYWSRYQRLQQERRRKPKIPKSYPLKQKGQTKLRRVK